MRKIVALASALLAAPPAIAEDVMRTTPIASDSGFGFSRPSIVAVAMRDVGKTGPQMGLPSRLWCGHAIERWRRLSGLRQVGSARAIDQARGGRSVARPVPGSIMVSYRRRGGHADIVADVHADGSVTLIRPNWTRRVQITRSRPYGRFVIPG